GAYASGLNLERYSSKSQPASVNASIEIKTSESIFFIRTPIRISCLHFEWLFYKLLQMKHLLILLFFLQSVYYRLVHFFYHDKDVVLKMDHPFQLTYEKDQYALQFLEVQVLF